MISHRITVQSPYSEESIEDIEDVKDWGYPIGTNTDTMLCFPFHQCKIYAYLLISSCKSSQGAASPSRVFTTDIPVWSTCLVVQSCQLLTNITLHKWKRSRLFSQWQWFHPSMVLLVSSSAGRSFACKRNLIVNHTYEWPVQNHH